MSYSPLKPEEARSDRQVETFLRALNGADAPPVESLPPAQARQVLMHQAGGDASSLRRDSLGG